jgi:nitroreductase
MSDLLKLIEKRCSARIPFSRSRPVARADLLQVLEAARWSPTAHNMQNFEVVIVDDQELLDKIGTIEVQPSKVFLRENFQLLSFSEDELRQRKIGLLADILPAWMRDEAATENANAAMPLHRVMPGCPALMIVLYDARKRAPASEGDVLGMMSLGCVLENMWLMACSLGLGFHALSILSGPPVEEAVKHLIGAPSFVKVAFAARLGYPVTSGSYLRVRREVAEFTHWNRFGATGGSHAAVSADQGVRR